MATVLKRPSECSDQELEAFEQLVVKGGEVNPKGLGQRIRRAERLVFHFTDKHQLIGVGALKVPSTTYKHKVFKRSRSRENPNEFDFELGWVFVDKHFRGQRLSRLLVGTLLQVTKGKNVYATTKKDNEPMQKTNLRLGLKRAGSPFLSDEGDHKLILFTKTSRGPSGILG